MVMMVKSQVQEAEELNSLPRGATPLVAWQAHDCIQQQLLSSCQPRLQGCDQACRHAWPCNAQGVSTGKEQAQVQAPTLHEPPTMLFCCIYDRMYDVILQRSLIDNIAIWPNDDEPCTLILPVQALHKCDWTTGRIQWHF